MSRQLVVVDCETTGLDPARHVVLEIAAINVVTGTELYFAPWIPTGVMDAASPKALAINSYFEREVWALIPETVEGDRNNWNALWRMLDGNTLAGSNPAFDAAMLLRGYTVAMATKFEVPVSHAHPWHYRLADLAAYAAPNLGLLPNELPGLKAVCEALGVELAESDEHTALGDARATAECFRRLIADYAAVTK